jgi:hypothetical protein
MGKFMSICITGCDTAFAEKDSCFLDIQEWELRGEGHDCSLAGRNAGYVLHLLDMQEAPQRNQGDGTDVFWLILDFAKASIC